jgi:hypothetical protein
MFHTKVAETGYGDAAILPQSTTRTKSLFRSFAPAAHCTVTVACPHPERFRRRIAGAPRSSPPEQRRLLPPLPANAEMSTDD